MSMDQTVVGLFDNLQDAQQVVSDLVNAGFKRDNISLIANDAAKAYAKHLNADAATTDDDVTSGEGASFGAVVGALTGVVVGLGALAIPGIGPVLAAGPLIAGLTGGAIGAAAGALTGGVVAGLIKTGMPEEDAQYYAEGVRRGGTLVTVTGPENLAQRAYDIMNRHGAINIDERVAQWRQSGWKGFDVNAKPYSASDIEQFRSAHTSAKSTAASTSDTQPARSSTKDQDKKVLPVVEEELQVGKREVEQGGVRVYKTVSERPVEEQVTLREEHVNVERRPVDRAASAADANAFKETSFEMTERSEEAVVSKQARIIEEVIVSKDVSEHTETVRDTVRRTDVKVEQTGATNQTTNQTAGAMRSFDTYANDFRTHYTTNYAKSGYTFDQYSPAYRYGYNLASDKNYSSRTWNDFESDVRSQWESRNKGTWEDFKDAIRYGWERFKNAATSGSR